MPQITQEEAYAIIECIKEHYTEHARLNDALNDMLEKKIPVNFGGEHLCQLVDYMTISLKDKAGIIEWYIYENEFGKNKLSKNIAGKNVYINSTKELLSYLAGEAEGQSKENEMISLFLEP